MKQNDGVSVAAFEAAARYRIVIRGGIPETWRTRLGGMTLDETDARTAEHVVVLVGTVRDQAELSGVLETLFHLHATILNVERIATLEHGLAGATVN